MTKRRIEEVRRILVESHLQGFLLTALPNIRYLTGFSGSNGIAIVRPDEVVLVTDSRYQNQLSTEVQDVRTIIAPGSQLETVAAAGLFRKKDRIGFEANALSFSSFKRLKEMVQGVTLTPKTALVENIRSQKDEHEITATRQATQITDKVFNKILAILKPGIREREIAAEVSYWHKMLGAESDAFEPIVASGARGAMPHARATEKKIKNGEMVTIDIGCRVSGYHSDLTRTVCVGKPPRELKKIYGVVLDAQQKALESATPEMPARTLDGIARNYIRIHGYGKFFTHSLGHGLGLEIHEIPLVSAKSTETLKDRSVITIEPGIYIPHLGGVRIEDDIVVRCEANEVLTKAPKQLMIL